MINTISDIYSNEISRQEAGAGTFAGIDLDALSFNVKAFKAHVGDKVQVAIAVKANAYGHGAVPIAKEALKAGATYLLVARLDEGIELRLAGIKAPVLVMGYVAPADVKRAVEYACTLTIINEQQIHAAAETAESKGVKAPVHIKADTGMHRNGANPDVILPLAKLIGQFPSLHLEGVYTHFACADEECKDSTLRQLDAFNDIIARFKDEQIDIPILHAANSAAAIDLPQTHFDMVRCGIAIYGLYGSSAVSRSVPLKPVLTLAGRIERLHDLRPGDGVSYGFDFVATQPTSVALISIGYGDGYQRHLSNRAEALVRGRRAKILGRVCMDQLVINVSDIEGVKAGDRVLLIGEDKGEKVTVEELAAIAGTNENDIVTGLSARIPRLYFSEQQLVLRTDLNS